MSERAGDLVELRADVGRGALHGEAGDGRRAAGAGRAVVRREARVGAADGHAAPARRRAPRRRSARTPCAGPGPSPSCRRGRRRGRPPRGGRRRSRPGCAPAASSPTETPRPTSGGFVLVPADRGGDLLDVADEVRVERLAAGAHLLARRAEVLAAHLERVEPRSGARPRRPATRRSTAGASRRRRGTSRPARGSCRRTTRRRGRPPSGTGRARRRRRSRPRAGRCLRRRRCRTGTRPRARAGGRPPSPRCASGTACCAAAS